MKKYIYWDNKGYKFFEAENDSEAYHWVINRCDLSYEPNYMEVLRQNSTGFEVKNTLLALRLKRHFEVIWTAENLIKFKLLQS